MATRAHGLFEVNDVAEDIMERYFGVTDNVLYDFRLFLAKMWKKRHFLVFALSAEEAEFTAYIRRNGRMTVPKEVRDALGIKEGNLVKCKVRKVNTG